MAQLRLPPTGITASQCFAAGSDALVACDSAAALALSGAGQQDGILGSAVIKGQAGPPDQAPHHVDGLSGATITSNGITRVVRFWLGNDGYGPLLKNLRDGALS